VRTETPKSVDLVVVSDNTEGEYSRIGGFFRQATPDAFVLQTGVFTQKGCERVIRYAFDLSEQRKAAGYAGPITHCTKSNAVNYSMVFWDDIYGQVAGEHPEITTDMALVDALTMWFVKNPEWFDVVVASNLFGDIITDLKAMLRRGTGLATGGTIDPEHRYPSKFEPIHGSAPM
jgi:tartrate dehydrogenase/decarboxylase/D-malate dehydrogenase